MQVDKEGQRQAVQQGETIRAAEKPLAFVPGLHTWGEGLGTAGGAAGCLWGLHKGFASCFSEDPAISAMP